MPRTLGHTAARGSVPDANGGVSTGREQAGVTLQAAARWVRQVAVTILISNLQPPGAAAASPGLPRAHKGWIPGLRLPAAPSKAAGSRARRAHLRPDQLVNQVLMCLPRCKRLAELVISKQGRWHAASGAAGVEQGDVALLAGQGQQLTAPQTLQNTTHKLECEAC